MGMLTPLLLAFLELTFVMVSIMLLHSLKRTIGSASLYLSLGMFLVFGQLISAAGLQIDPGLAALQVNMGSAVLMAPYMAAILVVYIVDGTLEAQRLILGLLAILFGFFYLAYITATQCASGGYATPDPETVTYIGRVFLQGRRVVAASFIAHAVDLFVLPIVFQLFHNRNCRLFVSVVGTLVLAQVIDTFVFQLLGVPEVTDWWHALRTTYLARAAAMVWLAVLTTIYLHMCHIDTSQSRRPLDIVVAFFGAYGHAQRLQKHIREWEDRYRVVVEHSSDLIFILNADGRVLNANDAALRLLEHDEKQLTGLYLPGVMRQANGDPCAWRELWLDLNPPPSRTAMAEVQQEWVTTTPTGKTVCLDASVSRALLHEQLVAVVIARDVSERRRMEREREELRQQMIHGQRLEAVGHLAGGVAHDFNNLLHTMQGSLDQLVRSRGLSDRHRALLDNMDQATSRASDLTTQLLGFARRGKYKSERLDVADVMARAQALFEPVAQKSLSLKLITAPVPMLIRGDNTQLQQVFLNMLLNARDAVSEGVESPRIVLRAEPASVHTPGWPFRPDPTAAPEDFVCVRIKDNGPGIPEDVKERIFEPFFTTKEVGKGTGMGLAMAYGCIANHNGWIQVESAPGAGTEFVVFLPRAA